MPDRTSDAVHALCQAVESDVADIVSHLDAAAEGLRTLEDAAKGLNGLPGVCRTKATELGLMREALDDEVEALRKRMIPATRPAIVQTVDSERMQAVREAAG